MSALCDLSGKAFGRWYVLGRAENQKSHAQWNCRCECGEERIVLGVNLRHNKTLSCGCLLKEIVTTHGHTKSRAPYSSTYSAWRNMKSRCNGTQAKGFHRYGGRGITVCKEWINSFDKFLQDMGERPKSLELDRINNDSGYSKENCRWVTHKENMQNRSKTLYKLKNLK
jgi:hypothetical protein